MQSPVWGKPDEITLEAESPSAVSAARINTPAIVILLGSTSAIAALELMRHMLTLRAGDRRRVALVYIDTDDPSGPLIEFRRQHNGVFQEFPVRIAVPVGISHIQRMEQNQSGQPSVPPKKPEEPHTFIEGYEPQYFASGAGGIRNNGHVAACFHYQHIYDALDRALVSIMRLDNTEGTRRVNEVQAHIVAFIGGGTGSGILVDVAVMVRDLLANYQFQQRINLFCMLPEPVRGASLTDLSWRKSNATACLLEVLAFSGTSASKAKYRKYMRGKSFLLTNNPIANEAFLIGHSSMDDVTSTARIVGLDVFQRVTDASGVGFLERSKGVDRRTLAEMDDRGMPTMFGTSCPLEVRFPAEETATAFAHLAAANLLPMIASYRPAQVNISDTERNEWAKEWKEVARFDASTTDPRTVTLSLFKRLEFEETDPQRLDQLWSKLERWERETERKIESVIDMKRKEEEKNIQMTPQQVKNTGSSLLNLRIRHLQQLQQEYIFALEMITGAASPRVPLRPVNLEADLIQPTTWIMRLRNIGRDYAQEICSAYNVRMRRHAEAARRRLLENLLKELVQQVQEELNLSLSWFAGTDIEQRVQELETQARINMAWRGYLEYPHPHQRHIFDLRTLRGNDGRNIAVERLYVWATGGEKPLLEGIPIDYSAFLTRCFDYLTRKPQGTRGSKQDMNRLEEQSAGRLADHVVNFFKLYYRDRFQDVNLFELLENAAPPGQRGLPRARQICNYLMEHLQQMRNLMSSLIAFEAELWHQGSITLDTSIYLGMQWRDGSQRAIIDLALDNLGPLTSQGQAPMPEWAIDPHRLQVVYGQHAISLSTVRDFYLDQNSAMAAYLEHQGKWDDARGKAVYGLMPAHSSSEAQKLVRDKDALGYNPPTPLYERVIRKPVQ